jgi:hypothetical protein
MKQIGPTKPPQMSHALILFWAVIFLFMFHGKGLYSQVFSVLSFHGAAIYLVFYSGLITWFEAGRNGNPRAAHMGRVRECIS